MQNVKIIDAIMGSGKTYDAIGRMKKKKGKFMYVTPLLTEVDRIVKKVPKVFDPKISYHLDPMTGAYITKYKRDNLLINASKGLNMATTHRMFEMLDKSDYHLFEDYDLILDEVIQPINILDCTKDDIALAMKQGLIVENPISHQITFTNSNYKGKFEDLKRFCNSSEVIYVNNRLLVWTYPPEIFRHFKSVTVLTYLFEGSFLAAYFKYYGMKYKIYLPNQAKEEEVKKQVKDLLQIYYGSANSVGDDYYAFSKNWLYKRTKKQNVKLKKSCENLIQRNFKTEAKYNAFTTFKALKGELSGKGYTKGFIPVNARATNDYSDKKSMFYLANRFMKPEYEKFFKSKSIKLDDDQWALSELIQWVWRGSIRKGEPMNLFIPSKRMRELLEEWIDDIPGEVIDQELKVEQDMAA